MKCPYCSTDNREDREICYHCGKDISMLRLITNRARHHYNVALEHAERERHLEALAELQHCLELDASFFPAHVVMGTIYAKMEKFADAERCWQAALFLDPHIRKAHEYLDKSRTVQRAVPLLRRLRQAVAVVATLAVLLAFVFLWRLWPTRERSDLRRASTAAEQGDYGAALTIARYLKTSARTIEIQHAASLLEAAIAQYYEWAAMTMLGFLLDNKPVEAHEFYQQLAQRRPPPDPYRNQLDMLDRRARQMLLVLIDSWRRQFDDGKLSYEEFVEKAENVEGILASEKMVAQVKATVAAARQAWAARVLSEIPSSVASTTEALQHLERLRHLASRVPEARDEIASANATLLNRAMPLVEKHIEKALAAKDSAVLLSCLHDLKQLTTFGQPDRASDLTSKALVGLRRLEAGKLRARLAAARADDIPQLDIWAASFESVTSTALERDAETSKALTVARRRLATEVIDWCSEREARFGQQKITGEEARWIVQRAEFALRYARVKSWLNTLDCVTFCAAVASVQLGDNKQALAWFDRLEKNYPKSPYVRPIKRYREKIAGTKKVAVSVPP